MELNNGIFFLIVCAFLVQIDASLNRDIKNGSKSAEKTFPVNSLPPVDGVGALVQVGYKILYQITSNMPTPMNDSCSSQFLIFDGFEVVLRQHPLGDCSYCCPFDNFADHVHLYFTNKAKFGNLIELKLTRKAGAFRSAGVNKNSPTVIYIHGFTEDGKGIRARKIRDAYLSRTENYNIILVDWKDLCAFPWYKNAAGHVKHLGAFLAKIIKFYNGTGELPISKIHLVGLSLGGQIVGFIGKYLKDVKKIPRITALDPAFPLFPFEDISQRLSEFDADFVDVIHTDAGLFGYPVSLGHADFYPNGGKLLQPGCELSKLAERKNVQDLVSCGHIRSTDLYVESVRNPAAFPASKCSNVRKSSTKHCSFTVDGYMGFPASKSTTLGNFYLTTNDDPPFSRSAKQQENDVSNLMVENL